MAELKNMLLTAGHGMQKLAPPFCIKAATEEESYIAIGGKPVKSVPGDTMIGDSVSVISSILRGPDDKSRIDSDTKSALFTVYAPKGIGEESIMSHLDDLYTYIRLFSAQAAASCVKIRPPMHA